MSVDKCVVCKKRLVDGDLIYGGHNLAKKYELYGHTECLSNLIASEGLKLLTVYPERCDEVETYCSCCGELIWVGDNYYTDGSYTPDEFICNYCADTSYFGDLASSLGFSIPLKYN